MDYDGPHVTTGPTYTTAGKKQFVTRVFASNQFTTSTNWAVLTGQPYSVKRPLFHNIPNGAGPGTWVVQSLGAICDWTLNTSKDKVLQQQRAYTGHASWEQFHTEDGGNLHMRVLGEIQQVNIDGIIDGTTLPGPPNVLQPSVQSAWYPAGSNFPTFDRLMLMTGPTQPNLPNGFPLRTLGAGNTYSFAAPGNCRFFDFKGTQTAGVGDFTLDYRYQSNVPAVNFAFSSFTTISTFSDCLPAWSILDVTNTSAVATDFSLSWNRFPMFGA